MTTSALEDPPDSFVEARQEARPATPFAKSLDFGREAEKAGQPVGLVLATLFHGLLGLVVLTSLLDLRTFAEQVQDVAQSRFDTTFDIAIDEPKPEPEPEPEPEEPPPPVPEEAPAVAPDPTDVPEEPAPAAAETAAVLTAPTDAPLDLTDQGILSGSGTRFSGGVSAADGTATTAVRKQTAIANGVQGGRGTAPAAPPPPTVDKSQPAGLILGDDWSNCPFPPEADAEQQNQAVVRLVIVVGPDGRPSSVNVLSDPGYGFGQAARQCAMRKRYTPGLDALGKPVSKATPPFRVRFQR